MPKAAEIILRRLSFGAEGQEKVGGIMEKYIGQTLKNRYTIREVIGVGGMAVVYKAYDDVLARDVAVKILKDEYMQNEEFRRRFTMESKAIIMLMHENIVDIYDVCLEGDVMFIAMEYLDGVTLKEYIDSVGMLEWHEATQYIKQILSAVQHAHERGIVHRDLKPQNIMLLPDGTVKVMDFGIARVSDYETQTFSDETIGSVHYISPEQASGDALDERTDIYAIGIMLYQFTTGSLPFDGETAVAVALKQIQEQPALPRDLNGKIPVGLEQIILKAIMKNPSDRYAEASDMLTDIERIEGNPGYIFHYDDYSDLPEKQEDAGKDDTPEPEEPEEEEQTPLTKAEKRKLSTKLPIFAGFAGTCVLFVMLAVFMITWPKIFEAKKYEVPNLIDKMYDEVIKDKEYEHFDIVKKGEKSSEKKKGTIIFQSIEQFTMVKDGTKIEVFVSSGVQTTPVPDVVGKSEEEAKNIFEKEGIPFICERVYSDTVAEGYVIRTSIAAGDEVNVATDSVIIYVSKGSASDSIAVPNVVGMTKGAAEASLGYAGLRLNPDIEEEFSDDIAKGKVVRQSPAAGRKVAKGSAVRIYISKGPDPTKEEQSEAAVSVTVIFDKSYTDQKMTISIKQGAVVLHSESVDYSSLKNGHWSWFGSAEVGTDVTVSVDGQVQDTIKLEAGMNPSSTISMTGGSYQEPPKDADVSITLQFDSSFTNQKPTVAISCDGSDIAKTTVGYDDLSGGVFTWNGKVPVGSQIVVSVDDVPQKTINVTESGNSITVSVSGGGYVPPEEPTEPTTPENQEGEGDQQP